MPKISQDIIQQRLVDRDLRHPQMVGRFADSPLQQQVVEQTVDCPVPRGRGDHGSRQGSQRTVAQIVDILAGGGLQDFLPDPGVAASAVSREEPGHGFFSHFSPFEKVWRSSGVRMRGCTRTRAHPS